MPVSCRPRAYRAERRPSMFGLKNGRSLTFAVLLTVLALSGTATFAQSEGPSDPMAPSAWTGTYVGGASGLVSSSSGTGYVEETNWESATIESSDHRFSGAWRQTLTFRQFGGVFVKSATGRLENDGGSWSGSFQGYAGLPFNKEFNVFKGEGSYEGLTAVFTWTGDGSALEGVIVPGELPPPPDLVAPPG